LFAIYLATATYDYVQITDTRAVAISAWSLAERGTLALPTEWEDVPWRSVTPDGDIVTNRFPGPIFWTAPFYALAPTADAPSRAFDVPYGPAAVAAAAATALAMAVMFLTLDGFVSRRLAVLATLVLALGTATWSVSADAAWTHGPAQLTLALGMLSLRYRRWGWAGLALGAAMLCRPQLGVVAAVVGVWLGVSEHRIQIPMKIAATASVGFAAIVAYSRVVFGRWTPIAGYSDSTVTGVTGIVGDPVGGGLSRIPTFAENFLWMMLEPRRGLLLYSPFMLVLLPGIRSAWRAAESWARAAAVAGLVALVVQIAANPAWWGGSDFFAYRLPLEMLTLATPLVALAAETWALPQRWARLVLTASAVASVVIFALGSTVWDPRVAQAPAFREYVNGLGPNGEGYDPGTAIGYDATKQ
jgi:hypothetical protein